MHLLKHLCRQIQSLVYMLAAQMLIQPLSPLEQSFASACYADGNSTSNTPQDWTGNAFFATFYRPNLEEN